MAAPLTTVSTIKIPKSGSCWDATLCRHVGISRSDYDALEALAEHGSFTPGELGARLSLTSGSAGPAATGPTQKAWEVGQDELAPYLEAVDAAARELSDDERSVVVGFLTDLADKVAQAPSAPRQAP